MVYHWLATGLLVVHATFVVFVVAGGVPVLRWPLLAWIHVPAVTWGAFIEFSGRVCPLTPLENTWRMRAGEVGYQGGFIAHYLLRALYPAGLTRPTQWVLGAAVVVLNACAYGVLYRHHRASRLR